MVWNCFRNEEENADNVRVSAFFQADIRGWEIMEAVESLRTMQGRKVPGNDNGNRYCTCHVSRTAV